MKQATAPTLVCLSLSIFLAWSQRGSAAAPGTEKARGGRGTCILVFESEAVSQWFAALLHKLDITTVGQNTLYPTARPKDFLACLAAGYEDILLIAHTGRVEAGVDASGMSVALPGDALMYFKPLPQPARARFLQLARERIEGRLQQLRELQLQVPRGSAESRCVDPETMRRIIRHDRKQLGTQAPCAFQSGEKFGREEMRDIVEMFHTVKSSFGVMCGKHHRVWTDWFQLDYKDYI